MGEPRTTRRGDPLSGTNKGSYRVATIEKRGWPPRSLADAIGDALGRLSDRRVFLHRIRSEGGSAEFFIGWFFDDPGGDTLPYGLLARAADLGIDLSFDVYPPLDASDDERSLAN